MSYFSFLISDHGDFRWLYVNGVPIGEIRNGKFSPRTDAQGRLLSLGQVANYDGPKSFGELSAWLGEIDRTLFDFGSSVQGLGSGMDQASPTPPQTKDAKP